MRGGAGGLRWKAMLGEGEKRRGRLMKIGMESTSEKPLQDILFHPTRYSFIPVLNASPPSMFAPATRKEITGVRMC
jgi:hypothetical protein